MKRSFDVMVGSSSAGNLPNPSSLPTESTMPNHLHHLGDSNYIAVTYLSGSILIHLREYQLGENDVLRPTKKGITISPLLWISLMKKMDFVRETVTRGEVALLSDSLIISKAVLDTGVHYTLQKYFKRKNLTREFCARLCTLTENEFLKLTNNIVFRKEVTHSVLTQVYTHVFPYLVLDEVKKLNIPPTSSTLDYSDMCDVLTTSLIELLRAEIQVGIDNIFECYGCTENYENQLGHDCMTLNFQEKLSRYGDLALLNINLQQLAHYFVDVNKNICNYINENFFSKLSAENLLCNAKELYVAMDPLPLKML